MSGPISRIGGNGAVRRDTPSSGHEQIAKRENQQAQQMRRPGVSDEIRDKVKGVASMYEKQFLGEMMKAMRSTVTPTNEPSMAENIYKDQLDSQYVDSWGENGGIGLSNLIYDQIMEKYFGESATQALKQQGPVALTDRDVLRVSRVGGSSNGPSHGPSSGTLVASNGSTQIPLRVEVRPSTNSGPAKVQAPWDANVVQTSRVDGKTAVTLEHGEGVRSTLIFDGVPSSEVKPGYKLAKGQSLGVLNPDSKSFFWNLNHSKTSSQSAAVPSAKTAQPLIEAAPQPAMESIAEADQANRAPAENGVAVTGTRSIEIAEPAIREGGSNDGTEAAP